MLPFVCVSERLNVCMCVTNKILYKCMRACKLCGCVYNCAVYVSDRASNCDACYVRV